MTATLRVMRPLRRADAVWAYQIVLDGSGAGQIRNGATIQIATSAGTHTLQIRSLHAINRHLGLASQHREFGSHPPSRRRHSRKRCRFRRRPVATPRRPLQA